MDAPSEIREFLSSRRARITPDAAGLPAYGGANRRVKGLRREEVAMLAGVSVDYYTQLERGRLSGVSEQVLAALGQALQLDEAELAHLHDLASAAKASPSTRRSRAPAVAVRPTVQRMLDAMVDAPAWVRKRPVRPAREQRAGPGVVRARARHVRHAEHGPIRLP